MKKIVTLVITLFIVFNSYSQSPKIQQNLDEINTFMAAMDKGLQAPNWGDDKFTSEFKSNKDKMYSKIRNIANDDSNYSIAELEKKLEFYQQKYNDGREMAKDEENKKKYAAMAAQNRAKDEGITNPIHQKYIQKIVFSASEISKTNPNENAFTTDFQITNPIHFRIYLKECIFNTHVVAHEPSIIENQGGLWCKIYFDGKLVRDKSFALNGNAGKYVKPEEKKTLTTLGGILNFKDENLGSFEYIKTMIENEVIITPGKHTFKMEIYPRFMSDKGPTNELLASGEFNLNVTNGFVDPSNYVVCMPTSKKKDPALEAKFTNRLKGFLVANNDKSVLKKFVLRSSEWEIEKNETTGRILSRTMYGAAGFSNNGKCYFKVFSFTQFWDGKNYQSTISVESTGGEGDVFCDCLK